jgi:membrane-associated protein
MDIFHGENLLKLVETIGYLGIGSIVFAETAFLVGFFLPGDSLLFAVGFLAAEGYLNIYLAILSLFLGSVIGDNVGYFFGRRVGHRILNRKDTWFFKKENLIKAEEFYQKYGPLTMIVARFIPFVRAFAPLVAGISKMKYRVFLPFSILGGLFWTTSITLLSFWLSEHIPNIEKWFSWILGAIVVAVIVVPITHIIRAKYGKKPTVITDQLPNQTE